MPNADKRSAWRWYLAGYVAGVQGRHLKRLTAGWPDRWYFRGYVAGLVAQRYGINLLPT